MNLAPASQQFHYDLMAAAIRYIEQRLDDQPSLEEVAAAIGLSPTHFQRVFSQWVGVSPKRYLQHLTLARARELLARQASVLDTAYACGLSGPSRLHDLFLRWEAMTPGEYARQGKGLEIAWGWFDSPFGEVLAMGTGRGLCGMAFAAERGRAATLADMRGRWPAARLREDPEALAGWVGTIFGGTGGGTGDISLQLIGAPFQIKVWEALLAIPPGEVISYSEIARRIGRPRAVRAVGTAVGRNPLAWLIPCHRVLRRDGGLGGYHWGLPVKRAMLAWESARAEAPAEIPAEFQAEIPAQALTEA
ncbi:MAG TPA: bifunctional helix-turn-helix domain-containing protein/methylated-DNA--[protein]-cysteine S-methyltransferase [Thermohalobaculum sp.]|nr:bifunctional helix-turn-helix domain-containing protein/methylated-DNA--[protein]-cysteine S-methyltransferase [Thermohalobaculum sp.]